MGYSFIIPVFNCRETLAACVESIRAAGLSDYEILLSDDGSTDGSAALCDQLAAAYPEIRCFHQPHAGVSAARNRGLAEAKKAYILFADGDDTLDGDALRDVLQYSGDLLIFGMTAAYYHRNVCFCPETCMHPVSGQLDWRRNFVPLFGDNTLSPVWNKVYRREILEENHLRFRKDMAVYEDLEFVLRYLKHCKTVTNVPKPAYRYRQSSKAAQRVRDMGKISVFLRPLEAALEELSLSRKTVDAVRLRLFKILAWEKCGMTNAHEICEDFRFWYEKLEEKPKKPGSIVRLMQGSGIGLALCRNAISLRHAIAVEVKTWLRTHIGKFIV